jgi:SAM-dependent methyltransferase
MPPEERAGRRPPDRTRRTEPAPSSATAGTGVDRATLLEDQPTVLGLARLSGRPGLAPGERLVYRRLAQLVELEPEREFLVVPCGRGLTTQFMSELTGASGSGVDPDAQLIALATEHVREIGLADRLHFDRGAVTDLPYKDDVFHVSIGDVGIAASAAVPAAVAELVRVTRPMGRVVLIQPVWNRALDDARREELVERLGMRPLLLVEWKQMLREAGIVELLVEDLVDAANPWQALLGLGGNADLPTVRERVGLLSQAWRHWGWRGLVQSIVGGQELRRLITRERVLGLALIKGTKWRATQGEGESKR